MYVNTYIIPIDAANKDRYLTLAKVFADVAKDFGALEIFENWEEEIPDGKMTDYRKAVLAMPNEKIVLSWVIWPDRATADYAHQNMFNDARLSYMDEVLFDGKRMILGGFKPMLAWRKTSLDGPDESIQ
jgi:uncharacterized protein YbaA (DUF1428 family)